MKPCKRMEIVIESALAPRFTEQLRQLGAPGFTLIPDVRGTGDRGERRADELSGESSNCLIIIACPDQAMVDTLIEEMRPLLTRSGGMCLVSDAMWLRH